MCTRHLHSYDRDSLLSLYSVKALGSVIAVPSAVVRTVGFVIPVLVCIVNFHICDLMVPKSTCGCNHTVDNEVGHGAATAGLFQYCMSWEM